MGLTVLERPEGHLLSTTAISAIVSSAYGTTDATIGKEDHGLADGAYVYIDSDFEDYNGFWYVDVTSIDTFKIKQYPDSEYVQYVQDASVTYYVSDDTHGWSAVHLPITYRIATSLVPHPNQRTIIGVTDDGGLARLSITSSFVTPTTKAYDYVEITTGSFAGVYQILELYAADDFTINLAYDATDNPSGATILRYLSNFTINVNVYAGIDSGHEWGSKKPYELASTLELIPDPVTGEVFFSVHEILKAYVRTVNNPLIGTQPNNIDFWAMFYIEMSESYDLSDGYSLGRFTSPLVSDQGNFEGYIVNSMLEFKNLYSGFMSEYLMQQDMGKFLTLFNNPVIFSSDYQDISFIKSLEFDYTITKQYYLNGVPGILTTQTISGDVGVYRVPLTADCNYDRVDITLSYNDDNVEVLSLTGSLLLTGFAPTVSAETNTFVNPLLGELTLTGQVPTVTVGPPD